ncbi:isoprenylcysteine carboxylmethyltransferase family protein [Micromonospora sp. NBC_01796]|nr:isoprenylcysteine carboxylmethyltransferase family protein [Micromonospora sp. NBC_01796]
MSLTAVRYTSLVVPVVLMLLARRTDGGRRATAGAALAFLTAVVGLAGLHEVSLHTGWYAFAPVDGAYRGFPVDLWLGWAVLWGPLPVLLHRILPVPVALGLLLWLDAIAMPALHPLVVLGPHWLLGEVVGLFAVALPAQLLGRWTARQRRLGARTALQMAVFTGLTLWLVPNVAFELGDGSWGRLTGMPPVVLLVLGQVGLLLAVPALSAVGEFVRRGGGTPFPWDPPRRLVSTGPYAYLGSPMQCGMVPLMLLAALVTGSLTLALAGLAGVAFNYGVARPHERHDLSGRYGQPWRDYHRRVRDWWPRLTPYPDGPPAVLWLDEDCGPCAATAGFLRRRGPVGLTLAPAGAHPAALYRARYEAADGYRADGVAAVARGLEHVNLGWAYLGWLLRLPGIGWLAQVVTDAMIAPPHLARRRTPQPRERDVQHEAAAARRGAGRHP